MTTIDPQTEDGDSRSEIELIESIRRRSRPATSFAPLGIGDDCAVLQPDPGSKLVVTTDQLVEGVHFERRWMHPCFLGRKALRVSLSDVASMGAAAEACLLSVTLPREFRGSFFDQLLESLLEDCATFCTPLVGGDLAAGDRIVVTTTVIGSHSGEPLLRSSAGAGDGVGVAGQLGWSRKGLSLLREGPGVPLASELEVAQWACCREEERAVLAHLLPSVLIEAGLGLAAAGVRAAIDVSDGFGRDLGHVLRASGVGAEISSRLLAGLAPGSGGRAEKLALEGGEDYALIFALPPGARLPAELEWTRVGSFSEKPGELVLCEGDSRRLYSAKGYDHFA